MDQPIVITIRATVHAPVETVWKKWNDPDDILKWNTASPEWHTTRSVNDLRPGGKFCHRMEARDGSFGFDFSGTYDEIVPLKSISSHLDDHRKIHVVFESEGQITHVTESFEAESSNPVDMQEMGWQAILNSFRSYVEV